MYNIKCATETAEVRLKNLPKGVFIIRKNKFRGVKNCLPVKIPILILWARKSTGINQAVLTHWLKISDIKCFPEASVQKKVKCYKVVKKFIFPLIQKNLQILQRMINRLEIFRIVVTS